MLHEVDPVLEFELRQKDKDHLCQNPGQVLVLIRDISPDLLQSCY